MRLRQEPKSASAFTKFRLLMWKNLLQQWRHPKQTVVEFLLPVLTVTLVLLVRWQVEPSVRDVRTYPPIAAHTLNFSTTVLAGMNNTRMSIAYSPRSPLLEDVIRSAMANLLTQNARDAIPNIIDAITQIPGFPEITIPPDININSTKIFKLIKKLVRVEAYDSSYDLRGLYAVEENTRLVIAAVEFDDKLLGSEVLSNNLTFALRFPEKPRLNSFYSLGGGNWRTDSVFPLFEVPGPRFPFSWEGGNDPGYVNEMFIALQHVISNELVCRVAGEPGLRAFRVNVQRFPHPSYVQDLAIEVLQLLFPSFIMLSFSYTAVNIVRGITMEKELQLKETMKIMGLPTALHWMAWFCKEFMFLIVSAILIVVLLKVNWFSNEQGFAEYAVFTSTPWTVLFCYILLYLTCVIFFSFMISGFFSKGSTAALFMGVVWFLTYIPAFLLSMDIQMSTAVQILTCLSINSAMSYGFQLLLARESTGGLQWGDFMSSPETETSRLMFGEVVIMLAVDCVLYMLITLYLEQVYPGPFGTPKPWYFLLQKDYWCPRAQSSVTLSHVEGETVIKENDPTDLPIGVQMNNLTKIYGANMAVNKLSLNIYDNQITVLLGHNGAGKSTTIAMLTGNLEITHGSVKVAGYDMGVQTDLARAHIGLCPQHNVLFNQLTVKEHLEFFARLKGFSGSELDAEIESLIEKLELQDKRDYQAGGLSGGQKRRLSVGIALSGAARVVLLDEPTSGMDPSSRRALWDLLQKEKHGRSMILTTHFMDEADVLGDRVAIMAGGRLQCVGSPYFLKRHYGVGYSLVVVKGEGFDARACSELISRHAPAHALREDRGSEVTYGLLNEYAHVFEALLNDMERSRATIKYRNYGLVPTTLEDVFMSVGSDLAPVGADSDDAATTTDSLSDDVMKHETDSSLEQLDRHNGNVAGLRLLYQHACAVWMKLALMWARSWWLILLQFLVPVFLLNTTLGILQYMLSFAPTIRNRMLSLTQGYSSTETLLSYAGAPARSPGARAAAAYELMFRSSGVSSMELTVLDHSSSVDQYYLNRTHEPAAMGVLRNRLLIGATFAEDSATAWFSNFGYHDVATSLAAVHGALVSAWDASVEFRVHNHPLEATYRERTDLQMMLLMTSSQVASAVGSSLGIVSAVFIMFYIKERVTGAKLLQKAAGVRPAVLWGAAAVFDWLWFLVINVTIVISCAAFDVTGLSTVHELGRMYLCVMVYGAAMLPLNYVFSLVFKGPAVGFVSLFFVNVLLGITGTQIVEALASPVLDTQAAAQALDAVLQFYPLYSLVSAVKGLNQIGMREHSCLRGCEYLQAVLPNLECTMQAMCDNYSQDCCVAENAYFKWESPGVLRYLVVMVVTCCALWAVLMTTEYRLFQKIFTISKRPPPLDESELDEDVAQERARARSAARAARAEHALLTRDLSKYYGKHLAVDQISFSVGDDECFGLLGVNGAGKTSTFKMLMGDESISSGEAFVSGYSVQKQLNKVHENIGYCPQFDALFGELTGRETLQIFSLMRGLPAETASYRGEALSHALGFYKHLDKKVDQYSGGTKRKLNAAISFLGRTRLVFVDEPTTGIDPAAKRHVWRAVRGVQRSGRGVVLTSHSMEECEALCSRLTIMVNGRFQCLGTPQHLKNKFSQGFTLTIKLKPDDNVHNAASTSNDCRTSTDLVKNYVNCNFTNPRIMEEYRGLITYYLPDRTMPWSKMFGVMERGKRSLAIEDYTIAQTTLEQIFLQFTKYQRDAAQTTAL